MNTRSRPTITVITVTLNDREGLTKTLSSVQAQVGGGYEHWVIDGGSTDGSREVLADYVASSPGARFVSEPDRGIFDAMNKGIDRSTGELLVFLNSGDCFTDPGVLDFVSQEWARGDWEWGYGAVRYVAEHGEVISGSLQSPFRRRRLHLGFRFAPWPATYLSRDLLRRVGGFDDRFGFAADQELAIRAAAVAEPVTWVRFMADFLLGGVHSQSSFLARERLWHRMRVHNGVPVLGSRAVDLAAAFSIACFRELRRRGAAFAGRGRR
ncbi:glycosyltransferase involved in cell wall biosynthesis [Mycetocola sp. CAN_C7]|uniref:glycosyltransferase family 2 protein n=1 Tax=Mycetocola sp. CAN_C7 TaxID=2787724 RepID=UPI0018C9F3F6